MRLTPSDTLRLATRGLRGNPLRFFLSALGIAVGVAAMVAVAGITQSSRAELDGLLSRLGTNLVQVAAAPDRQGNPTRLPSSAAPMLANIGPVTDASSVAEVPGVYAYRTDFVPAGNTNGLFVAAVDPTLLETLRGTLRHGQWLSAAQEDYPTVVLGHSAARGLGLDRPGQRVWLTGQWGVVVGILDPLVLAEELDAAVMISAAAAATHLDHDFTSTGVYVRTHERQVAAVASVAAATAHPQHPDHVRVSRPTDALTAQLSADQTFTRLLLGVAGVGLLVGGIGVSNTMVIAVMERRSEIGLRRALGATRGHVATQFLAESLLMATTGGVLGSLLGQIVTIGYSHSQGWPLSLPLWTAPAAALATAVVGAIAGTYPAIKASRQSPTQALSSP